MQPSVLAILKEAFPEIYQTKKVDHTFVFRWGATIYVRKSNENCARIVDRRVMNFPNGSELLAYLNLYHPPHIRLQES